MAPVSLHLPPGADRHRPAAPPPPRVGRIHPGPVESIAIHCNPLLTIRTIANPCNSSAHQSTPLQSIAIPVLTSPFHCNPLQSQRSPVRPIAIRCNSSTHQSPPFFSDVPILPNDSPGASGAALQSLSASVMFPKQRARLCQRQASLFLVAALTPPHSGRCRRCGSQHRRGGVLA